MSNPIVGPATAIPAPRLVSTSPPGARVADGGDSFADLVARGRAPGSVAAPTSHTPTASAPESSTLGAMGRALLARISRGERYADSVVHQGLGGRAFDNGQLLVMQAQVYRYSQDLDLASHLVDKATSAVRTVLTQNG